jgi:hypothetical protein
VRVAFFRHDHFEKWAMKLLNTTLVTISMLLAVTLSNVAQPLKVALVQKRPHSSPFANSESSQFPPPLLHPIYVSSRPDVTMLPLDDSEKAAFLGMQFDAQHRHYQTHFPAAEYLIIESEGRLYVDAGRTKSTSSTSQFCLSTGALASVESFCKNWWMREYMPGSPSAHTLNGRISHETCTAGSVSAQRGAGSLSSDGMDAGFYVKIASYLIPRSSGPRGTIKMSTVPICS